MMMMMMMLMLMFLCFFLATYDSCVVAYDASVDALTFDLAFGT